MANPNPKILTIPAHQWSPRTLYLTLFNTLFLALWMSTLVTALAHIHSPKQILFAATEPATRWLQTTSVMEIVHSASGLTKSPLPTTALQVLTRVIQVWLIWYTFPDSTAASCAFLALAVAWSAADGIRFLYLALHLHGMAPGWLVWLRYTMFYVLYPVGIGAEWWLFYQAIEPAREISGALPTVFYFLLGLYVPGAYTMYTYMIKQRRKTLGGKQRNA